MTQPIAGIAHCHYCGKLTYVSWIRTRVSWCNERKIWIYSAPRLACHRCKSTGLKGTFRYVYAQDPKDICTDCYTCQVCNVCQFPIEYDMKFEPASIEEFLKAVRENAKWWQKVLIRLWYFVTLKWVRVNLVSWEQLFKKEKEDEKDSSNQSS